MDAAKRFGNPGLVNALECVRIWLKNGEFSAIFV